MHFLASQPHPSHYRGYVHDTETGLYYLQSRYYDPETCRFINADAYVSTGQGITGYNMFAYCNNNPVMLSDPTGEHALGESCGSPSCTICRPEMRDFINSNIDWYNRVTGSNILGVTSTGQFIESVSKEPAYDNSAIYIMDNRNCPESSAIDEYDSNIKIWHSYYITDEAQIRDISTILFNYNITHPSVPVWDRSVDSMVIEWDLHNWAYEMNISRSSTAHVDLNNNDEGKGFVQFAWEKLTNQYGG